VRIQLKTEPSVTKNVEKEERKGRMTWPIARQTSEGLWCLANRTEGLTGTLLKGKNRKYRKRLTEAKEDERATSGKGTLNLDKG